MADESLHSEKDAIKLIKAEAVDLFNINCRLNILMKANWDCIAQIEDYLLLGEAKGHIKELLKTDKSDAGKESKKLYLELVEEIMKIYNIDFKYKEAWISEGFQLGNRIATQYYLEKNNVECLLLYILFIDDWNLNLGGDSFDGSYSVKSKDSWMKVFDKQLQKLGFESKNYDKIMSKFVIVFPVCIEQ